jgi:beta-xylosidase
VPGRNSRSTWIIAALVLVTAPSALAHTTDTTPRAVPRMVIGQNFPDPDVLETKNGYFAYATNTAGTHVQAAMSHTKRGPWQHLPDALPTLPSWIGPGSNGSLNIWAPDVSVRDDGTYLMYYTAFHSGTRRQCLGAATSASPTGPFVPTSPDPLICAHSHGDVIDPAGFVDEDGSRYLLYKDSRGAFAHGGPSTVWMRRVAPDGVTPVGEDVPLLRSDRPEENGVVEAPTMVRRPEGYVLFYSANIFDSGAYFTHYATAPHVNGPFTKAEGSLLSSDTLGGAVTDPGGQDVLSDSIVFHGDLGAPGGDRGMFLAGLTWKGLRPAVTDAPATKR